MYILKIISSQPGKRDILLIEKAEKKGRNQEHENKYSVKKQMEMNKTNKLFNTIQ